MNNSNSNHAKRLYNISEGKAILHYILDNDFTALIGGIKLWQKMEADEVCPGRTWQSMKNHFKRTIIADIRGAAHATKHSLKIWPHYEITPAELNMLKQEWKFQINSFVKPHIKSIMRKRLSPAKKTLSAKDKPDMTWLNPIISSSDEEEENSRKESEIGKKSNEKSSPTGSKSQGLVAILNISTKPSTQPESSRTKDPSVDKLQPDQATSNTQHTEENPPAQIQGAKDKSKRFRKVIPILSDDSSNDEPESSRTKNPSVDKFQPDQATSNIQHTEENPSAQIQGAKDKSKHFRKVIPILSDDDSSNDKNEIDQNKQYQESNQTCAINERLEEQVEMIKAEKISNGDARNIGSLSPQIPEQLGWVGKNSNQSRSSHRKKISFTVPKKERYLSEIEALKKLREQIVYRSSDIMTSDDDYADIGKSNPATPEQSHTATIVKGLKKSKHVKLKRIDPRKLTKSQKEHMKAARHFKNSRLKINPFAIGAQHFSKLKDVEIRPLWPK